MPPCPHAVRESRQSPGRVPRRVPPENPGGDGIGGQSGTPGQKIEGVAIARVARAREKGPFSCPIVPFLDFMRKIK